MDEPEEDESKPKTFTEKFDSSKEARAFKRGFQAARLLIEKNEGKATVGVPEKVHGSTKYELTFGIMEDKPKE